MHYMRYQIVTSAPLYGKQEATWHLDVDYSAFTWKRSFNSICTDAVTEHL